MKSTPDTSAMRTLSEGITNQTNSNILVGQKDCAILKAFVNLGDAGLNKIEAYQIGDTSLPSTVFHLERRFNLYFNRKPEEVKNRFHGITVFKRWLSGDELERARKLIEAR